MSEERIPIDSQDTSKASEVAYFDLYQKPDKIYPRGISGFYQKIRLYSGWPLLLGYFILPFIPWGDRPAVLFDLPAREFHIFFFTFWPQDFALLAWVLMISAFGLFFITTWAGRIWCGYTCPQTVWTAIFMWIEQQVEGSRNARMKLDKAPWSRDKLVKKAIKHVLWLGVGFVTGLAFVAYFVPIQDLLSGLATFSLHPWSAFWIGFFTLATYGNAGFLREQVCKYMCPYARFQSAMFDKNTLIVSYDKARGEPRGKRKKDIDPSASGLGDCIDCQMCVQVCPTGIDIRNGLQYECINCALCIDACNQIMDQMNYDRGLIRYTTENALEGKPTTLFRPKFIGYGMAMVIMIALFSWRVATRTPLELDVIRDRGALYTQTSQGLVQNTYTLKIINMSQASKQYVVSLAEPGKFELLIQNPIEVAPGEVAAVPTRVVIDPAYLTQVNMPIEFKVTSVDGEVTDNSESRFIGPRLSR